MNPTERRHDRRPALNVGTAQRRDGDNPDTIQSQEHNTEFYKPSKYL